MFERDSVLAVMLTTEARANLYSAPNAPDIKNIETELEIRISVKKSLSNNLFI